MIAGFAAHELRQQLRGRVFPIVFAVSMLMVTGAMIIDELRVGLGEGDLAGSPEAIVRTHLVWSLFFLFTAAAFVGEAVLRDRMSGFGDLVHATPVTRWRYALGRFGGAFAALVLCFTSVPLALAIGGAVLGPGSGAAATYLFAFFVLALPNLLLASALFFTLAGATRSMTGCLLGAAGLLTLYGLAGERGGMALVEPFGFAAIATAQHGTALPAPGGALLANRVLWLCVAAALVWLGTVLAARNTRPRGRSPGPHLADDAGIHESRPATHTFAPMPVWRIVVAQILVRTSFEARRIVLTPAFAALLMMGLAAAAAAASRVAGTPSTIAALTTTFQLVPVVVILFFAGELFWAEREHHVAPIVMATPVHQPVLVAAKLLALAMVLVLLATASAAAGAAVELTGHGLPAFGPYLTWYIFPRTYDWLLLAALAFFLQSLAPNKQAGWGYFVFYLIATLALDRAGLRDPHYRYGGYPGMPLPPALSGAQDVGWYRLGWGMIAAAMIAVTCRRGLPLDPGGKRLHPRAGG